MSRLIPILLLSALILQTGFKVIIYLDYQVNKEMITLRYCENKAKPAMKCHGKCHLNKKLSEETQHSEQGKNAVKELPEISPFVENSCETIRALASEKASVGFHYFLMKTETISLAFFHPPS